MNTKSYFRVCHKDTLQGVWYDYKGQFTGLIHDKFDFCMHNTLEIPYDPEIVGWISATNKLEHLFQWFPESDILKLQKYGYYIHEFEATDVKHYAVFNHEVIKQDTSKVKRIHALREEGIEFTVDKTHPNYNEIKLMIKKIKSCNNKAYKLMAKIGANMMYRSRKNVAGGINSLYFTEEPTNGFTRKDEGWYPQSSKLIKKIENLPFVSFEEYFETIGLKYHWSNNTFKMGRKVYFLGSQL